MKAKSTHKRKKSQESRPIISTYLLRIPDYCHILIGNIMARFSSALYLFIYSVYFTLDIRGRINTSCGECLITII